MFIADKIAAQLPGWRSVLGIFGELQGISRFVM